MIKPRKCSIRSAKNKACRLQNKVRDAIRADNPDLHPDDVASCPMGSPGADIILSPAAKRLHPYSYEAKAHATGFAKAYAALAQANRNDGLTPVAVVQHDRAKPLAILALDDLRELQRLARLERERRQDR